MSERVSLMNTESIQLIDQILPKAHPLGETVKQESASVTLTWNLSDGKAYYPERNCPPAPVLIAFGGERMHACRLEGNYDYARAIAENPGLMVRSFRLLQDSRGEDEWADVIFKFGERAFLYGDRAIPRIVSYASTEAEAELLVRDFEKRYARPKSPEAGTFQLIRLDDSDISSHTVPLELESVLSDESFALHYPEDMESWHKEFEEKLTERKKGLSILEGKPGTGKTSYLRHLMGRLKDSHRFYFIPPATMGMLSNPKFIGFWAKERNSYTDKKLVVILEDADAVLMTRGSDNRDEVSALLNLSDGMLGDFLSLQIICTINCPISDIDQALLRPGRLISHRRFERLDSRQALKLASHIGKSLPEKSDYSLAEVFTGEEQSSVARPGMGFGG